jgi:hypothetical protein
MISKRNVSAPGRKKTMEEEFGPEFRPDYPDNVFLSDELRNATGRVAGLIKTFTQRGKKADPPLLIAAPNQNPGLPLTNLRCSAFASTVSCYILSYCDSGWSWCKVQRLLLVDPFPVSMLDTTIGHVVCRHDGPQCECTTKWPNAVPIQWLWFLK